MALGDILQTATGDANTATFGSTPAQGNLLVAISFHRSAAGSTCSISGVDWSEEIERTTELSNTTVRRGLAVYWKIAGASEATSVTTTWSPAQTNLLVIAEIDLAGSGLVFLEAADNDNGTTTNAASIATGTTASQSAANHLLIPLFGFKCGDDIGPGTVSYGLTEIDAFQRDAGGTFGRAAGFATVTDSSSGTKSDTISVYDVNDGLSAGILVFEIVSAATLNQEGYRFRDDDEDEASAAWLEDQDAVTTQAVATNVRLRMLTDASGDPDSMAVKLQYKRDDEATSEWRDI